MATPTEAAGPITSMEERMETSQDNNIQEVPSGTSERENKKKALKRRKADTSSPTKLDSSEEGEEQYGVITSQLMRRNRKTRVILLEDKYETANEQSAPDHYRSSADTELMESSDEEVEGKGRKDNRIMDNRIMEREKKEEKFVRRKVMEKNAKESKQKVEDVGKKKDKIGKSEEKRKKVITTKVSRPRNVKRRVEGTPDVGLSEFREYSEEELLGMTAANSGSGVDEGY
ncbi:unnamed protein product [Lasius platythorax]|uniref:Uncharacterized protein n=1 Tax=Lasius platythorax TaxID=488582 RepID=A0AAV2MZ88_9HYME